MILTLRDEKFRGRGEILPDFFRVKNAW